MNKEAKMEKSEGNKFIKFSSKIDKRLAKVEGIQAKQKQQGKRKKILKAT